jgi:hypothetical protein
MDGVLMDLKEFIMRIIITWGAVLLFIFFAYNIVKYACPNGCA